MIKIDHDIALKFYKVLKQKETIAEFEDWLYRTKELEQRLPNDLYVDLISMDYKSKYALHELTQLIGEHVDFGAFEAKKIKSILKSIIDRDANCAASIGLTYELYCQGYHFLQRLGLNYGLLVTFPPVGNYQKNWSESSPEAQNELLDKFYPAITMDASKVLAWLEHDKIIIKSTVNDLGHYEYQDLRSQEEKVLGSVEAESMDKGTETTQMQMNTQGFWGRLMEKIK